MSLNFHSSTIISFKTLGLALVSSLLLTLSACGGSSSSSGDSHSRDHNLKNGKNTTKDTSSSTKKPPKKPAKPAKPAMTVSEKDCAGLSKKEMLDAINKIRSESRTCGGKRRYPATSKLQWNSKLEQSAKGFATDMATNNYFGLNHLDKKGRSYKDRILATGYGKDVKGTPGTGENIAAGQKNLEDVMSSWLGSPSHCANIMNAKAKDFAMACGYNANSTYKTYWVQHFGATR